MAVMLNNGGTLTEVDSSGAVVIRDETPNDVQITETTLECQRVADLPGNSYLGFTHRWIRLGKTEIGAGAQEGLIPGQDGNKDSPFITPMFLINHSGQSEAPNSVCYPKPGLNVNVVRSQLTFGKPIGPFMKGGSPNGNYHFFNNCQTTTFDILQNARSKTPVNEVKPSRSTNGGFRKDEFE
jgi:hypothetical protein